MNHALNGNQDVNKKMHFIDLMPSIINFFEKIKINFDNCPGS
jgi:hypothetical protein